MVSKERRIKNRQYYLEHRDEWLKKGREYYRANHERILQRERLKYQANHDQILDRAKRYYWDNREKIIEKVRQLKLRALQLISGLEIPRCNNCSCDTLEFLEINHKNGGGTRDYGMHGGNMYQAILWGRRTEKGKIQRKTDDLEVLCRVCNSLHYLRLKYPKAKIYPEVRWSNFVPRWAAQE